MQIQLKQLEIEAALRMFIAQQGINLTGKTVEIAFTSGRGGNGLSAELTIEDLVGYVAPVPAGMINRGLVDRGGLIEAKPEVVTVPETTEPAVVKPPSLFSQ